MYIYRTVRNPKAPGGAEFVPELVHNRSGVGSAFEVADLNKDGRPDIVVAGAYGTHVFLEQARGGGASGQEVGRVCQRNTPDVPSASALRTSGAARDLGLSPLPSSLPVRRR